MKQTRALGASRSTIIPTTPFLPDGPFFLCFAETRMVGERSSGDSTYSHAESTGGDGSSPNPGSNEALDWEKDD